MRYFLSQKEAVAKPVQTPFPHVKKESRITADIENYYATAKKILIENRAF